MVAPWGPSWGGKMGVWAFKIFLNGVKKGDVGRRRLQEGKVLASGCWHLLGLAWGGMG